METVYPSYYFDFKCIADRCRHSCCRDWEIDIDPAALGRYKKEKGPLGDELRRVIRREDGTAFFELRPDGACPFLTEKGLCRLITEKGEGFLCDICREHPRFYNEPASHTECGLGLACEEAARIILSRSEPARLVTQRPDGTLAPWVPDADDEDAELLLQREAYFAILTDRTRDIDARVDAMLDDIGFPKEKLSAPVLRDIFLSLESNDPAYIPLINKIGAPGDETPGAPETAWEQLIMYLVYRHMASDSFEEPLHGALFAAAVWRALRLASRGAKDLSSLIENARLMSSQVEYSDTNPSDAADKLLSLL